MSEPRPSTPAAPQPPTAPKGPERRLLGIPPLKIVFALEYVLQGLANPFQGITYQPFFRHFRNDYGLSEAATQNLFAKSYLAWSFKPLIGFLIDAYGRTRTILVLLLTMAVLGFLLTPLIDRGATIFFAFMFGLSVVLAATDVSVDRATVIAGDEEARATGRSKATTVGLNQAICWSAIYGTGILAAVLGGYVSEHVPFDRLMVTLAIVPATVLGIVLLLPRDKATPVPIRRSVTAFWRGLNSGPILGVMLFYFIFHFQPAMGALWNNYLIETLGFTQTQIGIGDGATYVGYFAGVLLFAWKGVRWQDRIGLRMIFRILILVSIGIYLTQYLLVDPTFTSVTRTLHGVLPFWTEATVRLVYLCLYNGILAIGIALIRMSTYSIVGAVIPVAAAGSLFAGFMSIANLAYSFSYSSGAWLYEHGTSFGLLRSAQQIWFGIPSAPGDELSIKMLILVNAAAYLLSFVAVRYLPDRRQTLATEVTEDDHTGPERWNALGHGVVRAVNVAALGGGVSLMGLALFAWRFDAISSLMMSFFSMTMLRKAALDTLLKRRRRLETT